MSAPVIFELRDKRVFVTGHGGMVGSAIVRRLEREHCDTLLATRRELDLRHAEAVVDEGRNRQLRIIKTVHAIRDAG